MIQLTCTHCHAELNIDDGFAGGVCRCQHCGTIQTVPKKSKRDTGPATSKTLYRTPDLKKPSGSTDLDALADAVTTSSGLSSRRLRKKTLEYSSEPTPIYRQKPVLIAAAIGGAVLLILALLLIVGRSRASQSRSAPVIANAPSPAGQAMSGPSFLGMPIDAPSIIYVLDRGSGTSEWFSYLLEATFKSTETLGSDRKFQILFWSNGDNDMAYPSGGPEFATASSVAAARKALDSVEPRGQSDAIPTLTRALKSGPALIVLVTGKGSQLDDSFTQQVMTLRGGASTRIDAIDIADSDLGAGLTNLAKQTGGVAKLVGVDELKQFVKQ